MEIKDKNMGKVEVMADKKELLSDEKLQEVAAGNQPRGSKIPDPECMKECIKKGLMGLTACARACR